MFDFRHLEVFCKVVELGGFSRAAEVVHLAQASVSERIANLEDRVGVRLLDRLGRRVTPTRAGKLLYDRALILLSMKRDVCQELEQFLGVKRGSILIGASTIPGEFILPGVVGAFRKEYPGIMVSLAMADTARTTAGVTDGTFELGVVGSRGEDDRLDYTARWEDELVVAVPAGHRWARRKSVSVAELAEEPFVCREKGSGTRNILEQHLRRVEPAGLEALNTVAIVGTSTAVKESVRQGVGVSVLSSRALAADLAAGTVRTLKLKEFTVSRHFYLVRDRRRTPSPVCRAFVEFLNR